MNLTKSSTAKLAAGVVGFAMVVTAFMPVLASADTASDLQAQINSLLATIQSLQAQLAKTTGGSSMGTGYQFNTNLTVGSKGTDVMNLQKVLNMSASTQVASSGAGSPGNETTTFGPATKAAVIKFQTANGISPAAGYVGPITRGKLNSMGGTSMTPTPTPTPGTLPTGGSLMVSSTVQPVNSLAPKGAARVPFTRFTLTAGSSDVTVNSVTVQRTGFAQDAVFAGVVLLNDQGMQIGIAKTLNSNHQAMVGEPWVVKAGTSATYTVAGNMAASLTGFEGQVASLDVVAINTTASVTGSLPITGAMQTSNNSLTVGTASITTSSFDPNNAGSQPIGTTGFRFSGLRLTAGSGEDLTLKSIRWNQSGSAGSSDLSNVVTVVNGTQYPTTVSADGKYFSTVFPSGIVIAKGNSVDIYVQGDITGSGASGRVAEFDVYKNTDIYLVGNTYNYGITAPVGTSQAVVAGATHITYLNTTGNPWFEGSTLSITAGTVTLIGKANEVAAQNIAVNVSNQVLGGFATNFSGEPVSVQSMKFLLSTSSTAGTNVTTQSAVTNITIVDEKGAVVAGPVDAVIGASISYAGQTILSTSYGGVKFTDTVTFPIGRHVYTIKGKVPSAWANGVTINVFTQPSTDWSNATGQTTGNSIDLSGQSTAFSLNQMTVKGAALAINVSAQPAAQNVVGGLQGFVLANFQLDATQSGEDVRLSTIPVKITASTPGDLTGCQLWDGSTALNTGSGVINTFVSATVKNYSLDNSLVITKGTSKTIALACNVASVPSSASFQVTATVAGDWAGITGQTSGNTVIPTIGSGNGGLMAVTTGSFTASIDASTPNYAVAASGSAGVTLGTYKFRASNEDVNLTKIGLIFTGSGTASDIGTVYLYQGSTLLGTVVFPQGSTATATSTLNSALKLTKDTDVLVTVKADLAAIGSGQSGTEGMLVKIDVTNGEGAGLSSGNTLRVGGVTAGSNGVRNFRSYPTVSLDSMSSTGLVDGKLMRFKVTGVSANGSQNPVGISQMKFTLSTSTFAAGGGVSSVYLRVYSDQGYSSPVSTVAGGGIFDTGAKTVFAGGSPTTLTFGAQTNPLEIPAGSTYYFELTGSIAGSQAGATVATTLLGDSAYPTTYLTTGYSVATSSIVASNFNFVWSGNATSTAPMTGVDWSSGFGLLNLPSGGIIQTRSN